MTALMVKKYEYMRLHSSHALVHGRELTHTREMPHDDRRVNGSEKERPTLERV
jgi:hypothetical protein